MQTTNWDPHEAGKQADARDREQAIRAEQRRLTEQRSKAEKRTRQQRAHSVVRPAMYPIKLAAQQECAKVNQELKAMPNSKATVYEDLGGMGLYNIPSAFRITRAFRKAELIPDYENWQIVLHFGDEGRPLVIEVDEEVIRRREKGVLQGWREANDSRRNCTVGMYVRMPMSFQPDGVAVIGSIDIALGEGDRWSR